METWQEGFGDGAFGGFPAGDGREIGEGGAGGVGEWGDGGGIEEADVFGRCVRCERGGVDEGSVVAGELFEEGDECAGGAGDFGDARVVAERAAEVGRGIADEAIGRLEDGGEESDGVFGQALEAETIVKIEAVVGASAAEFLQLGGEETERLLFRTAEGEVGEVGLFERTCGERLIVFEEDVIAFAGSDVGVEAESARNEDLDGAAWSAATVDEAEDGIRLGGDVGGGRGVVVEGELNGLAGFGIAECLLEGGAGGSDEDFVGVERERPVGGVLFEGEAREVIAAELLEVRDGVAAEKGERQAFANEGGEDFAGAVGAVVIEDEVMIDPRVRVTNEGFDDIGFVFHDGDGDEFHAGAGRRERLVGPGWEWRKLWGGRWGGACGPRGIGQSARMQALVFRWVWMCAISMWAGVSAMSAAQVATEASGRPAKIEGLEIARPAGGFLGLNLVNGRFVLSFYDAEKKRMKADVVRASLRWPVRYQPSDERVVLNLAGDGTSLTSGKVIRPPHNFRVYIALFVEGNDDPVETYNVEFSAG